ncbi:hypothetical protein WK59_09325 [Burkholderia ubonensis]|uniref:hypothetical protein n=1 Tax=Burkholderia ubonensis TaxID=101571 RepID=UPI00075A66E9|nr:hypothetical protein [Burkholderia ubonensis]KVT87474.1 hypothetical protein WK59_09325 [Burkholderia ubonensis]
MSIQSYDIQIPAGGAQTLEAGGQIFDFLSSGSAFDQIQVLPEFQQGNVTLRLGQGFDAGAIVNRWYIKNPGSTAINGTVVLSTAGFRNFRISGDVNVLDGGKSRTLSGSAFAMFGNVLNGVAGQYTRVQLWNPAASTKRIVIETVTPLSGAATEAMALAFNTAQLTTLVGAGVSKLAGGAAATGAVYTDTTATASTAAQDAIMFQMAANSNQQYKLVEPIVLPPGNGLIVWGQSVNVGLGATFEWYEEPNT